MNSTLECGKAKKVEQYVLMGQLVKLEELEQLPEFIFYQNTFLTS